MGDDQANNGQALSQEQLSEVLADASEQSEAPAAETTEAEAKTETDSKQPEAEVEPKEGTEAKGDEDAGKSESKEDKSKSRSGIDRLKRRLAASEAEVAALRSRTSDSAPSKEAVEKLIGEPPKEEDFKGDFLAYEREMTAYAADRRIATRQLREQAQSAQTSRQTALQEAAEAHAERIEEFRGKVKDFDATMKGAKELKAMPHVEEMILESDKSAHLVYHLAKNPDRLARLNEMSERNAAREIGRIESRLSLPQPKTQTEAPAPVKPPKGGAAPSSPEKDLDAWLKKTYG